MADALVEAVQSGDRLLSLQRLRDALAETILISPPAYVAPLAKQLSDVMAEIEKLAPNKEASPIDDLASKRAARRKKAGVSKRAAVGKQRGPGSGSAGS